MCLNKSGVWKWITTDRSLLVSIRCLIHTDSQWKCCVGSGRTSFLCCWSLHKQQPVTELKRYWLKDSIGTKCNFLDLASKAVHQQGSGKRVKVVLKLKQQNNVKYFNHFSRIKTKQPVLNASITKHCKEDGRRWKKVWHSCTNEIRSVNRVKFLQSRRNYPLCAWERI